MTVAFWMRLAAFNCTAVQVSGLGLNMVYYQPVGSKTFTDRGSGAEPKPTVRCSVEPGPDPTSQHLPGCGVGDDILLHIQVRPVLGTPPPTAWQAIKMRLSR